MDGFMKRVQMLQKELNAPKNLYNKFGNFYYRNAESILEAFKPLGEKYSFVLLLEDEIVNIANRFYVKATATLIDAEDSSLSLSATAYAREQDAKKGMDEAQVTGTSSTYARKYALNGLFIIDDTKDDDAGEEKEYCEMKQKVAEMEKEKGKPKGEASLRASAEQVAQIKTILINSGKTEEQFCTNYGIKNIKDVDPERASAFIDKFKNFLKSKANGN